VVFQAHDIVVVLLANVAGHNIVDSCGAMASSIFSHGIAFPILIPIDTFKKSITSGLIGAEPVNINSILPPSLFLSGIRLPKNKPEEQS